MEASDLHAIDAWHPSVQGHRKLADSAYPVVLEQAKRLGWARTSDASSSGSLPSEVRDVLVSKPAQM